MEKEIKIPENYKYAAVFLTMRCNLRCSYCINNLEKSKDFNRNKFMELSGKEWIDALNKIYSRDDVPITLSGGEPSLHKDFIYIINNLKPELKIDILTNLEWSDSFIERFIKEVNPERLKRNSKYASIRVSYHPEQMDAKKLVEKAKRMQDAGFSIGIWGVLYPSADHLSAINQMQFICQEAGIDFRLKEYVGEYKEELYGDYSRYNNSVLQEVTKSCLCKTSELLIGSDGNVYRCHRDLYSEENPIGNITNPDFQIIEDFIPCNKYGHCNPCDVKVKTNYKQQLGHTSVEIKGVLDSS